VLLTFFLEIQAFRVITSLLSRENGDERKKKIKEEELVIVSHY
jgi:hypothetical protein